MRTDGNKKMQDMRKRSAGLLLSAADGHLRELSHTERDKALRGREHRENKKGAEINIKHGRNTITRAWKHAGKSCL